MRYALPIVLFAALAALVLVSPHLDPQRHRARARRLTEDLRTRHGFRDGSKAAWNTSTSTGWPPFHYGKRKAIEELSVDSLALAVVEGRPAGGRAAWNTSTSTGWPPFHYGKRKAIDGELLGTLHDL